MFLGISPRFYAAVAAIFGITLAYAATRIRNPIQSNLLVAAGLFGIGLVLLAPTGLGNLFRVRSLVAEAASAGNALRPPVPFVPGWQAIVGWLMGVLGFLAAWTALSFKKPALALVIPLPVAAWAAISIPDNAQVVSGIIALLLFALGMGVLSSDPAAGAGDDDEGTPFAYQLRKALKSLPLLAAVTVVLVLLAQTNILFPKQLIDPAQEPQRPKTVPLSEVEDRVLFEVKSDVSGPWRVGSLDVYDGKDWRLPPFAQNELKPVPNSGIVDKELTARVGATFTVAGLGGAVLPGLPNMVGIRAKGPLLAYDERNANIRLVNGQVTPGLEYEVVAAGLPSVDDLRAVTAKAPKSLASFADMPDGPPPAVVDLVSKAPKTSKWEEFDFLRSWILDNVTASGPGAPKSITAERIQDMIAGSKEATPFEIVAAQAMLARWIGVPSRIGYGFDGGDLIDGRMQVRPRNGASFVEVYFPGFKWLPVIGVPKKAKPTSSSDTSLQRTDPNILPSDDIAVRLVLPVITPAPSVFGKQVQRVLLIVVPALLLLLAIYVLYPAVRKARIRSRRRDAARIAGHRARVALAYAEWRDFATDLGCSYPSDTPLMFVHRFPPDHEHRELAWLTTRVLWGDLQHSCTDEHAAIAEELSRALRRRMSMAQPATLRAIGLVSRLSLRDPFLPQDDHDAVPVG
jgi:hypothetical protein